jgi:DNA repair protein RAD57
VHLALTVELITKTPPSHVPSTTYNNNNNASMTDLSVVLPAFPVQEYARLIPSLERNQVNTIDLLTLDAAEIAKRARLPLLEVKRLHNALLWALHGDLGIGESVDEVRNVNEARCRLKKAGDEILESWSTISTLDDTIDKALGGGIPTGYITEVTGERRVLRNH